MSAGGIGEAYARALAREGAAVVVADIDATRGKAVAADIAASGGRSLFVATDVSSVESADAAAGATMQA